MSTDKTEIPDMSQIQDIDDVIRILFGVVPEGEEIVVYEDDEGEGEEGDVRFVKFNT